MRDQNLLTIFNCRDGNDEATKNLLKIWLAEDRRGIIDCLNSVNLLSFYARKLYTPALELICQHRTIENLVDSNRKYASNYLRENNNMEGMNMLFHYCSHQNFKIDFVTLEHGLTYHNNWIDDSPNDHLFHLPKPWNM